MPRLFIAIDLPEQVKEALSALACPIPGAKWVGASEMHLTLKFIGEVEPVTAAEIKTALLAVDFPPFPLALRGVGHFPPHGHPRVLWVGLEQSADLLRLQQQVENVLIPVGIGADERAFSPHLTLARLRDTPAHHILDFETGHREVELPPFQVSEFILYSSVLTPKGAIHTKEKIYHAK